MAEIGLMHPVFAPIATEPANAPLTYSEGFVVAKATSAELTWNRSANNNFWADDAIAETDTSITNGTLKFGVDHLTLDAEEKMLGLTKTTGTPTVYSETGAPPPAGGFGYIRVLCKSNVISYRAFWIHKIRFGIASESATTKGETITWASPTVEGTILGVFVDATGTPHFRDKAEFATYAAAEEWLHDRAGID